MPNYWIDVWRDESIWSWAGKAESEEAAEEQARLQLNDDWDQDYETWDDLAADMDGTALLYDTKQDRIDAMEALLQSWLSSAESGLLDIGSCGYLIGDTHKTLNLGD